jgi:molecular chaperone GrpE (heat shock protein)
MNIEKIKEDVSKIPTNLRLDYNFDDGFIYLHNDDETFALFEKEEIARSYQNMPLHVDNLLFLHVEMTPEQIEERQKEIEEWLKPVDTEKLEKEIDELKEENERLRKELNNLKKK